MLKFMRTTQVKALCLTILFTLAAVVSYAEAPRLVVNIVVGTLRAHDLERFSDNFTEGGFKRLMCGGAYFTNASYDYSLTSTVAGLATLSTGAEPSVHGVIGERWWSYVDGSEVKLIADRNSHPVPFSTGAQSVSAARLSAPTLGDVLLYHDHDSKQFTVACDALSAIVLNGRSGVPFWVETNQTHWTTATAFTDEQPAWIASYNREDSNMLYTLNRWTPLYSATRYHNSEVAVVEGIVDKPTKLLSNVNLNLANSLHGKMCYTPAGNTMILEFASMLIAQEELGRDSSTDVLNICLDPVRYIAETYGVESIEYEDMIYRLDSQLSEFLTYLYAQVDNPEDVVVVLTSHHGTAPSYNPVDMPERDRLNTRQMEVILNAYLGSRYGSDNYLLGYANRAIYLNHATLRSKGLDIETIREEVAIFMLQMRGITTAISSSKLRNGSFADGRTRLMQQSFYATRSGDVIFDLQPGWTIHNTSLRTSSLAGYNYDREVPLMIYGGGIEPQVVNRSVNITEVAPTLSEMIGMERPWASSARPIDEIINN